MNNWEQSVDQNQQNSEIFAVFIEDDDESQNNNLKRHLNNLEEGTHCPTFEEDLKKYLETYDGNYNPQKNIFEREKPYDSKQQDKTSPDRKPKKSQKSSVYAKNYREKKKEKMKILEEQNIFLKKKVDELQMRLREKQMQINRLKFSSAKEQFNMSFLNQELVNKLKIISQPIEQAKKEQSKQQIEKKKMEQKMREFVKLFQNYGMGGLKSKQLLGYYINEYIQSVMRDGQKYYILKWIKSRNTSLIKTQFDIMLEDLFPRSQEELKNGLQLFMQVKPLTIELLDSCKEIYQVHKKVIRSLQKIHDKLRTQLTKDIGTTQKRMETMLWFHKNKYRKEIRQLRADWISMIKSQDQFWQSQKVSSVKKKVFKSIN